MQMVSVPSDLVPSGFKETPYSQNREDSDERGHVLWLSITRRCKVAVTRRTVGCRAVTRRTVGRGRLKVPSSGLCAFAKDVFINQERKLGARRRSDTVLVSTINDADQGSADVAFRTPLAPYEKSKFLGSGGSMVARLKLKGIDGRAPPGVEPGA
uniref:Uncharacterized protein n=1 Tax=Brassica oleracea var. oleracea TaxID=109376 RepID=A0A0D2ZRN1_BRAOL